MANVNIFSNLDMSFLPEMQRSTPNSMPPLLSTSPYEESTEPLPMPPLPVIEQSTHTRPISFSTPTIQESIVAVRNMINRQSASTGTADLQVFPAPNFDLNAARIQGMISAYTPNAYAPAPQVLRERNQDELREIIQRMIPSESTSTSTDVVMTDSSSSVAVSSVPTVNPRPLVDYVVESEGQPNAMRIRKFPTRRGAIHLMTLVVSNDSTASSSSSSTSGSSSTSSDDDSRPCGQKRRKITHHSTSSPNESESSDDSSTVSVSSSTTISLSSTGSSSSSSSSTAHSSSAENTDAAAIKREKSKLRGIRFRERQRQLKLSSQNPVRAGVIDMANVHVLQTLFGQRPRT